MVQQNSEGCMDHLPDFQALRYKTCDKKACHVSKSWGPVYMGESQGLSIKKQSNCLEKMLILQKFC